MPGTFRRFDPAEYLDTEQDIAAFLDESAQGGDAESLALALGAVARARNMRGLARATGLTRGGSTRRSHLAEIRRWTPW
jgi:probable addiction module antidote protein